MVAVHPLPWSFFMVFFHPILENVKAISIVQQHVVDHGKKWTIPITVLLLCCANSVGG